MSTGKPGAMSTPEEVRRAAEAAQEARHWALEAKASARHGSWGRSPVFTTLLGVLLGAVLTFGLP